MRARSVLALATLLSSMGIAALLPTAHAASLKTYRNIAHRYTFQYPATWTRKPHAYSSDVELVSPDTNAVVIASAFSGTATKAEIKAQQVKVLKGLGTAQGPLSYSVKTINGVSYQISEIVTKTKGKLLDVVLLDTVHGTFLYDFEALLAFNKPSTKPETATVDQILNSITLS